MVQPYCKSRWNYRSQCTCACTSFCMCMLSSLLVQHTVQSAKITFGYRPISVWFIRMTTQTSHGRTTRPTVPSAQIAACMQELSLSVNNRRVASYCLLSLHLYTHETSWGSISMATEAKKGRVTHNTFTKWQRDQDCEHYTLTCKIGQTFSLSSIMERKLSQTQLQCLSQYQDKTKRRKTFSDKWITGTESLHTLNIQTMPNASNTNMP